MNLPVASMVMEPPPVVAKVPGVTAMVASDWSLVKMLVELVVNGVAGAE